MTTATSAKVRISRPSDGYYIELDWSKVGDEITFYTHLPRYNADNPPKLQRQIGDVVRTGLFSPSQVRDFMDNGNFPWQPGEECLKHVWRPQWGSRMGKPQWGCKPCRDGVAVAQVPVPPVLAQDRTPASSPVAIIADLVPAPKPKAELKFEGACATCGKAIFGKSQGDMTNRLRLHNRSHKKTAVEG